MSKRIKVVPKFGPIKLAFCATGAGGGVDPSCGRSKEAAKASSDAADASANLKYPKAYKNREEEHPAVEASQDAAYHGSRAAAFAAKGDSEKAAEEHTKAAGFHSEAIRQHENMSGVGLGNIRSHYNAADLHRDAMKIHESAAKMHKYKATAGPGH